jgi:hypothetical protein
MSTQFRSAWDRMTDGLLYDEIREQIDKKREQIQFETGCHPLDAHMRVLIEMVSDAAGIELTVT